MPVAEALCTAANPRPGERVLDVACGTGNVALAAARRFCSVVGIDFVPHVLQRARIRAEAEGSAIEFLEADAQALPLDDASFDVVTSSFGVMFAPDQAAAGRELVRVCRAGGRIALASWAPEGFGADFYKVVGKYKPPPAGMLPPFRWGTESGLRELLGPQVQSLRTELRTCFIYYPSVPRAVDLHVLNLGPVRSAYEALPALQQVSFRRDLASHFESYNLAIDGTLTIEARYLQAVAELKS
jgi:SAM-dependent methyltransferase